MSQSSSSNEARFPKTRKRCKINLYYFDSIIRMNIGDNIQRVRKTKGLTQDELAKRANIPYTTIAKIESGIVKNPTIVTLIKIAKVLKVKIDSLTT